MKFVTSWHFKCRQDTVSGEYVLENSNGMLAGRVKLGLNGHGTTLVVVNSRQETALVLETSNRRNHHAVVLAPRHAVSGEKTALAVHGVIIRKANGFDTIYEYESSAGLETMQVSAGGFPRRLLVCKGNFRVAEIDKKPGEMNVSLSKQAQDTDVLVIIGIMLAVCLLLPMQAALSRDEEVAVALMS